MLRRYIYRATMGLASWITVFNTDAANLNQHLRFVHVAVVFSRRRDVTEATVHMPHRNYSSTIANRCRYVTILWTALMTSYFGE